MPVFDLVFFVIGRTVARTISDRQCPRRLVERNARPGRHPTRLGSPPPCVPMLKDIKISLYPTQGPHGPSSLKFCRLDRHFEGSCRADTAAHPGAARRGGTDGIRPHRDSPPIAAAAVAAFAAPDRGGPSGPFPRGILGLLPSRRTWRAPPACPRAYRPAPDR